MSDAALPAGPGTVSWAERLGMVRVQGGVDALDGLRALAIVLVLGRHAARPFQGEGAEPLLPLFGWDAGVVFANGWMGVDIFFVLSGFLIAHHVMGRYGAGAGRLRMGDYLARRALRIVPAYVAVLLIAAFGFFPFYQPSGEALGFRLAYHLAFLQDYLPSDIVVVFWSLGVEEKFYLAAPFLILGLGRLPGFAMRAASLVALALVPLAFRLAAWGAGPETIGYDVFFPEIRSPFHMSFEGLVLGVLAALVFRERARLSWTRAPRVVDGLFWLGALGLAGLLAGANWLDGPIGAFARTGLGLSVALASAALLMSLALGARPARAFEGFRLFVVSKLSYALYLVHLPLIPLALVVAHAQPSYSVLPTAAQFAVFSAILVALSSLAALALHYGVERPFLALRDARPRRS